ncbi:hypothetical protein GC175_34205 [bacterium]|nr:hypothetical protein [bacterium]
MNVSDPTLLNRLALVKQLYNHASEHGRSSATIDKIIAITSLDHAVEMLLEGVIQSFPTPQLFDGPPNLYFGDPVKMRTQEFLVERAGFFRLWDQVVAVCQEMPEPQRLPLKNEMRSLHLARNEAQHNVKVPSSEFLAEMMAATRTFLDHLLQTAFDVSLRQISEALMVQSPQVRHVLEMAQAALAEEDTLRFAGLMRLGFTLAQAAAVQQVQIGRFVGVHPPVDLLTSAIEEAGAESGLAIGLQNLQDYLAQLHIELTSLSLELGLGLERQSFTRFSLLTPAVPFIEANGGIHWLESGQNMAWLAAQLTPDTCLWMQEYALSTILKWEAEGLVGDAYFVLDLPHIEQLLVGLIEQKRGAVYFHNGSQVEEMEQMSNE